MKAIDFQIEKGKTMSGICFFGVLTNARLLSRNVRKVRRRQLFLNKENIEKLKKKARTLLQRIISFYLLKHQM